MLWLACAFWVFKDARRRIDDKIVLAVAVLTGLVFGPIGLIVYAIVRPPERSPTAGARARDADDGGAPHRGVALFVLQIAGRDDYLVCPMCAGACAPRARMPQAARAPWRVCPYCEADVPACRRSSTASDARGATLASRPSPPCLRRSSPSEVSLARTFVMVKPDGVERGLVGEVISRFERRGFGSVA